jgi:diadenosine tetraphosphatase ApaH/serine/threonine PP2A family protein phosphatase
MGRVKLALFSDIHGNRQAFEACLVHARAAGATQVALLGDLVGYGGDPAAVLDTAIALSRQGAVVLKGNHDEAALAPPAAARSIEDESSRWAAAQLGPAHRAFLRNLPLSAALGEVLLVHASADEPAKWRYVDSPLRAERCLAAALTLPEVRHVFCGHVHHQRLFYSGRRRALMAFEPTPGVAVPLGAHRTWVATVGSVGQPRDGDARAMYALFDAAQGRLCFHRVAYDHYAAAAAIRRAGLPEHFATRLEQGR